MYTCFLLPVSSVTLLPLISSVDISIESLTSQQNQVQQTFLMRFCPNFLVHKTISFKEILSFILLSVFFSDPLSNLVLHSDCTYFLSSSFPTHHGGICRYVGFSPNCFGNNPCEVRFQSLSILVTEGPYSDEIVEPIEVSN